MELDFKTEVLFHIKAMLQEFAESSRWQDVNNPQRDKILDIGERIKSPDGLRSFREDEDFELLFDIVSIFEECFNDDWLPHEIIGLKLIDSRIFLKELIKVYDKVPYGQWTKTIQNIHSQIKTHYNK